MAAKKFLWKCPRCNNKLEVHVSLSAAPACHNTKIHTRKPQIMELISGGEDALVKKNAKK